MSDELTPEQEKLVQERVNDEVKQRVFLHPGAHRVVAMCNARNEASYKIMEKLGMTREAVFRQELPMNGEWDDQYFYAMLDSEWQSIKKY